MSDQPRKNECPMCHQQLLYREGEFIKCAKGGCDFQVVSKRETDIKIPTFAELRRLYE